MDDLKKFDLAESNIPDNNDQMEEVDMEPVQKSKIIPIVIIAGILIGLTSGFMFAKKQLLMADGGTGSSVDTQELTSATNVKKGDVFGSADEKTFRDQAEGIISAGGIDGEGSHHIERGDNKSQWVYITSSVVDLDLVIGDRVMVWGETNQGKKAGWLMDVGRLKILELDAAEPTESMDNE